MRVTVPRRIFRVGILLAFLCLTPAISSPVFAQPKPWEDQNNPNPPAPKGDGDGTVVKAAGSGSTVYASSTLAMSGTRTTVRSWVQSALQLVRLGYGFRWYL
jgi:hypothetical protein